MADIVKQANVTKIRYHCSMAARAGTQFHLCMLNSCYVMMQRKAEGWEMGNYSAGGSFRMLNSKYLKLLHFGPMGEAALVEFSYQVNVPEIITNAGAEITR